MKHRKHATRSRGFTLVELIVVIAVIAVLTAVIIPSFNRFIDQSRFSNDIQSAQGMSNILQNHMTSEPYTDLDAQDVRNIIDLYHGEPYNYTPQAKDTGFFYVSGINRIIAAKFDEADETIEALSLLNGAMLLNDPGDDENNLPEQLFHQNSHLLSFRGSAVAEVVHFVSTMANQGSAIDYAYGDVLAAVNSLGTNPIVRLFGFGLNQNIKDDVLTMLEKFAPDKTLFVNNVSWVTTAGDDDSIDRIVFSPGISNIPEFTLSLPTKITLTNLVIPRTVNTIQTNAFPKDMFDISTATLKQGVTVSLDQQAFPEDTDIEQRQVLDLSEETLIDYSYYVRKTANGYDLSALRDYITEEITGYNVFTNGQYYEVLIYTSRGLIGFARNIYTINYYYNFDDLGLFITERSMEGVFVEPAISISRTGYDLCGWSAERESEVILSISDPLEDHEGNPIYVWNVYAQWSNNSCS
jgi:prepilin-type N-terminal cleavage/methylation domain-containing protein